MKIHFLYIFVSAKDMRAIQFCDIRPSLIWKAFAPKFLRILFQPIGNHDKCTLCNSACLTAGSSRTRHLEWFLLLEDHTHNNWCMNQGLGIKMLQQLAKLRIRNHRLMPSLLRLYITAKWIEEKNWSTKWGLIVFSFQLDWEVKSNGIISLAKTPFFFRR